jgi:hypothetical protein
MSLKAESGLGSHKLRHHHRDHGDVISLLFSNESTLKVDILFSQEITDTHLRASELVIVLDGYCNTG